MHVQFCCMLGQEFGHRKKASRVGVITNTQRLSNLSSLDDHPDTVRYSYGKLYRRAFFGTSRCEVRFDLTPLSAIRYGIWGR